MPKKSNKTKEIVVVILAIVLVAGFATYKFLIKKESGIISEEEALRNFLNHQPEPQAPVDPEIIKKLNTPAK